jgi:D-psicose/D-tagatose/L-ribulose 3-epimerase
MQLTRRSVLLGAGAAAALSGQSPRVRFGVRTPFPNLPLRDRAKLLKRLGFDGIELGNEWTNQPAVEIQSQLEGTGIAVSALVGSIELLNPDPKKRQAGVELDRRQLAKAKQLGADCVIEVPVFGDNRFPDLSPAMSAFEAEEAVLVAEPKQLAVDVQRTGVTLLLEPCNHKETHFLNKQDHAAELIHRTGAPGSKMLSAPGFKVLSDFYHMQLEEKDIGETLGRMGALTGYVHLADGEKRTEPGSLPFDYRPGFRALKRHGYAGWLTIECKASDEPEAALGRALRYLKQQWSEA